MSERGHAIDAWQYARASYQYLLFFAQQNSARIMLWSGHVLLNLKLPPHYTGHVVSHRVVHITISMYQSLAFVVDKPVSHGLY